MAQEKTLKELSDELYKLADERGCNFICIVEEEGKDGFNVMSCGDRVRLSEMIAQASQENEMFGHIFKSATISISLHEIDAMLIKRNPLVQKTQN